MNHKIWAKASNLPPLLILFSFKSRRYWASTDGSTDFTRRVIANRGMMSPDFHYPEVLPGVVVTWHSALPVILRASFLH
jgi:hypothetical protein